MSLLESRQVPCPLGFQTTFYINCKTSLALRVKFGTNPITGRTGLISDLEPQPLERKYLATNAKTHGGCNVCYPIIDKVSEGRVSWLRVVKLKARSAIRPCSLSRCGRSVFDWVGKPWVAKRDSAVELFCHCRKTASGVLTRPNGDSTPRPKTPLTGRRFPCVM